MYVYVCACSEKYIKMLYHHDRHLRPRTRVIQRRLGTHGLIRECYSGGSAFLFGSHAIFHWTLESCSFLPMFCTYFISLCSMEPHHAHATQGIFSRCVTTAGQSPFYGTKNLELLSLLRCTKEVLDFKYCSMGGRLLHRDCWIHASGYRPWPCIGWAWVSHKMCRICPAPVYPAR